MDGRSGVALSPWAFGSALTRRAAIKGDRKTNDRNMRPALTGNNARRGNAVFRKSKSVANPMEIG